MCRYIENIGQVSVGIPYFIPISEGFAMDQAAAAALVGADQGQLAAVQGLSDATGQPQVRLVVRLGMDIPVTLTLDENGSVTTVGLGRPSFDVQDCEDNSEDNSDDDDEDSDDDNAQMDTEDDSGYESDNSVVFLGEVIHLD